MKNSRYCLILILLLSSILADQLIINTNNGFAEIDLDSQKIIWEYQLEEGKVVLFECYSPSASSVFWATYDYATQSSSYYRMRVGDNSPTETYSGSNNYPLQFEAGNSYYDSDSDVIRSYGQLSNGLLPNGTFNDNILRLTTDYKTGEISFDQSIAYLPGVGFGSASFNEEHQVYAMPVRKSNQVSLQGILLIVVTKGDQHLIMWGQGNPVAPTYYRNGLVMVLNSTGFFNGSDTNDLVVMDFNNRELVPKPPVDNNLANVGFYLVSTGYYYTFGSLNNDCQFNSWNVTTGAITNLPWPNGYCAVSWVHSVSAVLCE
jgi:uncharacterized protein YheU (UPF0270 family)